MKPRLLDLFCGAGGAARNDARSEPLVLSDAVKAHYDLPDHFAAYPCELVRRVVLGWSLVDGVILDPFSGTGTTVGVARALGRIGIGLDISADYCRLGKHFIERTSRYRKVMARTNAENQGSLV